MSENIGRQSSRHHISPGIVMLPSSSEAAGNTVRTRIVFGRRPEDAGMHDRDWRLDPHFLVTSPRSEVVIAGVLRFHMPVASDQKKRSSEVRSEVFLVDSRNEQNSPFRSYFLLRLRCDVPSAGTNPSQYFQARKARRRSSLALGVLRAARDDDFFVRRMFGDDRFERWTMPQIKRGRPLHVLMA